MYLSGPVFTIRPAREEDLLALVDVYRQCEDFLALGPVARASETMVRHDREAARNEGGEYCVLEMCDGVLAGVVDIIPAGFEGEAKQAFLELLMVAAPFRSRGFGEQVMAAVEGDLRARGARTLLTAVQVNNPRAQKFWERMGFQRISGPQQQPDGTTTVRMEKLLAGEG